MEANYHRAIGVMKRAPVVGVMALLMVGAFMPVNAYADGTYRWKDQFWGAWLDINGHKSGNGELVRVSNYSKSNWQLWRHTKLSNGWYRVRNVHTGRSLDRWDSPTSGHAGNGSAGCPSTMWDWWGGTQQQWKTRKIYVGAYGRSFYLILNKKGCGGSKYHEVLGTLQNYSNADLYTEDDCTPVSSGISPSWCFWRKNGK